jgi:hypothetical protein
MEEVPETWKPGVRKVQGKLRANQEDGMLRVKRAILQVLAILLLAGLLGLLLFVQGNEPLAPIRGRKGWLAPSAPAARKQPAHFRAL